MSKLNSTGKWMLGAGYLVGNQALSLYRAIDPDVTRHLIQLPFLSYSLFSSRSEEVLEQEPDGYRPLIFVHGLGGTRGDFLPMVGFFWINGRRRTYRISFDPGQTIQQMAEALARFIDRVREVTGENKVNIVSHSLGGVISRIAVLEQGLSRKIGMLITLGSPHHGTYSARFGNTLILRELRPDSALIKRIKREPWPKEVRGVSFWSKNDVMILPAESALVRGMKSVDMTPFTHYSYLLSPKSWRAVEKILVD